MTEEIEEDKRQLYLPLYKQDLKSLKFLCSMCGACCRRAGESGMMPNRGDGACVHLTQDNKCSIYETRPELCNLEKMWLERKKNEAFKKMGTTKKEYFKLNTNICNQMILKDRMDSKYLINIKEYDEMEDE